MEAEVYKKLEAIFRDNFDDETLVITADTTAQDIEDWDSLEMVNLITLVEEGFGIKFNIRELTAITGAKNVGEMVHSIKEKL